MWLASYWFSFVVAGEGHHVNWRWWGLLASWCCCCGRSRKADGKREDNVDLVCGGGHNRKKVVNCCERKEKGKKRGRRKRRAGANGRWMLMASERKRELEQGDLVAYDAVVKGRRKGEGKSSVAGWSSWEMDVNGKGEEE
ncbi:hypothetical protein OIU85_003687 [Salix viminalis]|uniref:Uncharacterized protein n=1 Tax=Salix viminalis TaxID=40686 RepID=A0A9Q0T1T9_SALVM|nr:hypothetical protein OIU85_003687 [Salix viminalis]